MKRLILLLAAMYAFSLAGIAQQQHKSGTAAAQFLKIGVGGKGIAMAGATAGIVDDASAMYWNPAGLVRVEGVSMFAGHTEWFADLRHQFFSVVLPLGENQRIGVGATIMTMDDMEITTELEPKGTGNYFSATDVAVSLSYSARLATFFSFGATVKYISQSLYNESASAIAVDLGTTLDTGFDGLVVGMTFSNFGTTMQMQGRDLHKTYDPLPNNATNTGVSSYLATQEWELPVNFRVGVGWNLVGSGEAMFADETHAVRVALDANHPNDAPENAAFGLEYTWSDIISVRGGYHVNDDVRGLTYGLGLQWRTPGSFGVSVDYASMTLEQLGLIHVISLAIAL